MNPFQLFDRWYAEAKESEPADPNAMALATASPDGLPSVRMVLLKDHGPDGFVFYTNMESRKGDELTANPRAALCFHWKSSYRQVRIEGPVVDVTDAEADAYFASRGRAKQLAAAASDQSRPLSDRQVLEDRIAKLDAEYEGRELPRPPHWTGQRVIAELMEFWEGERDRMHRRRLFVPDGEGGWKEGLLYP